MQENEFEQRIWDKINGKTKPLGSLGLLERLAVQVATFQQTLHPKFEEPTIIVFAGDHGIAEQGVSAYPQEVTYQMVYNFLEGGAAINVLAKESSIQLKIVDAGVKYHFPEGLAMQYRKVAMGTNGFHNDSAMTEAQLQEALAEGIATVDTLSSSTNVVGFGEMGIGNTSAASMIMHKICQLPITDCVGRGTGLDNEQLTRKLSILERSSNFHRGEMDAMQVMRAFGGFEMAQMTGAMIRAWQTGRILLVDGFIATASYLVAHELYPDIQAAALFCHQSDEAGHKKMLSYLGAEPILQLGMRLGEGTGCAMAYPLISRALAIFNNMASFEEAGVSKK